MDPYLFDKRVVRRNIEKGLITQQEYLTYLEGLSDVTNQCEPVEERLYSDDSEENEADAGAEDTPPAL